MLRLDIGMKAARGVRSLFHPASIAAAATPQSGVVTLFCMSCHGGRRYHAASVSAMALAAESIADRTGNSTFSMCQAWRLLSPITA